MPEQLGSNESLSPITFFWLQSQFNQIIQNQGTILKRVEDVRKLCTTLVAGQKSLAEDHRNILLAISSASELSHAEHNLILDAIAQITAPPPPEKAANLGIRADAPVPK